MIKKEILEHLENGSRLIHELNTITFKGYCYLESPFTHVARIKIKFHQIEKLYMSGDVTCLSRIKLENFTCEVSVFGKPCRCLDN